MLSSPGCCSSRHEDDHPVPQMDCPGFIESPAAPSAPFVGVGKVAQMDLKRMELGEAGYHSPIAPNKHQSVEANPCQIRFVNAALIPQPLSRSATPWSCRKK